MQKSVLGLFVLLIVLSVPQITSAETKVNISNNGDNSKSKVTVNNSGDNDSETHIIIDQNGERKEYHGTDDSVHLESDDGKNSVNINKDKINPSSTSKPTQSPIATSSASPSVSPSPTPNNSITINGDVLGVSNAKEKDTLFEYLSRVFNSIWSKFF